MSIAGKRKGSENRLRFSASPPCVLVIFLIAGCLLGRSDNGFTTSQWSAASVPLFFCLAFIQPSPVALAAAGLVTGIARKSLKVSVTRTFPDFGNRNLTLQGKIMRRSPALYGNEYLDIAVKQVMGMQRVPLDFRLAVKVPAGQDLCRGEIILLRASLEGVHSRGSQEFARGKAKNGSWILRNGTRWSPVSGRRRLARVLDGFRDWPTSGLLGGFTLGDRWMVNGKARDVLKRSGTYHFLAISGVHIGASTIPLLILLRLWGSLARNTRPRRTRAWLLLLSALAIRYYLVFTGPSSSAFRAVIYLAFGGTALLLGRISRPAVTLSWCLAAIILFRPGQQPDTPLVLSALAVTGILLALGPGTRFLSGMARVTMGAILFTLSIAVWFAGGISLVAPLGNILLGIPFGLFLIPYAVLLDFSSVVPFFPLETAVRFWFKAADPIWGIMVNLADLPISFLRLSEAGCILASALTIAGLLLWWRKGFRPGPAIIIFFTITALSATGQVLIDKANADVLVINFPNVGQADSTIIRYRGRTVLIDCGPPGLPGRDGPTARALQRMGIRRIEALFLSHDHPDHTGGLQDILVGWPVGTLYAPPGFTGLGERVLQFPMRKAAEINYLHYANEVRIAGMVFHVLGPRETEAFSSDINRGSLTLLLRAKGFSALFTGDAGWDQVARSLIGIPDLRILKVPHHGSKKGFPVKGLDNSLRRVVREGGLLVVCPSRRPGSRHLPAPEIIRWLKSMGVQLEFTGEKGVKIRFKGYGSLPDKSAVVDIQHWF